MKGGYMNNVIPLYNPYGMAGGNPYSYQQQYQQPQQYTNTQKLYSTINQ